MIQPIHNTNRPPSKQPRHSRSRPAISPLRPQNLRRRLLSGGWQGRRPSRPQRRPSLPKERQQHQACSQSRPTGLRERRRCLPSLAQRNRGAVYWASKRPRLPSSPQRPNCRRRPLRASSKSRIIQSIRPILRIPIQGIQCGQDQEPLHNQGRLAPHMQRHKAPILPIRIPRRIRQ